MKNINSLKKTAEYKEVYEKGKYFANRLLVVYILKKEGPFKIGISVSKKVGGSVDRHRTIRLIRESYISLKPYLPENFCIVVVARPSCKGKNKKDIESALRHALCSQGIIK